MLKLHDIKVWSKAVELSTEVYRRTQCFPPEERFGLTSQIRRAAVSIASNIAEGYGRNQPNEFVRFLSIAAGSLYELRTQLIIAKNIGFLSLESFDELDARASEVERMLLAFIQSIEKPKH